MRKWRFPFVVNASPQIYRYFADVATYATRATEGLHIVVAVGIGSLSCNRFRSSSVYPSFTEQLGERPRRLGTRGNRGEPSEARGIVAK